MLKYKKFNDNKEFIGFTYKKEKNHTTTKPLKPLFLNEKAYFKNDNWKYSYDCRKIKKFEFKETTDFIYDFCDIRSIIEYFSKKECIKPHKRNGRVSVCIPCYGKQDKFIIKAVESALQQTYKPTEIILLLMDEESIQLKDLLEKKDSIIKCYVSEKEYVCLARLKLAKLAKEDWICFLDADDTLPEFFLEELMKIEEDADCYITFANLIKTFKEIDFFKSKKNRHLVKFGPYSNGNLTGLINKEIFIKYCYDKRFEQTYEDVFFIFNCCKNNIRVKFLNNIFFNYFKNEETEASFINLTDDLKNNHDSTLFKRLIVNFLKESKIKIKFFESDSNFKLFKKLKSCGYRTYINDYGFFYSYFLRRNRILFQKILKSRSKTPISSHFNINDYDFINIKKIYINILNKEIQNFSFDVLFLGKMNFYNFYDKEIKYIVRKELSNKPLEELINNYSCACMEFDFTLSDLKPESKTRTALSNKLEEIKKITKDVKLIKEINFMNNPKFASMEFEPSQDEYNENKYYSIIFYFDKKISDEENFEKIKKVISQLEKTGKSNEIKEIIIPSNKNNNLFAFSLKEKGIDVLQKPSHSCDEYCNIFSELINITYYLEYDKISRCINSKFLEKPENWTKKINLYNRLCSNCHIRKNCYNK